MNRSAAAVFVAAWLVVGTLAASFGGCIPDLPAVDAGVALPTAICGDGIVDLAAGEQCDPGPGAGDAGLGGCSATCQMQCPSGGETWSVNNHCYQLGGVNGASQFRGANAACPGASHVVTFASDDEFLQVLPLLAGRGPFWVGLAQVNGAPQYYPPPSLEEPGWWWNCPGCFAHTPTPDAELPELPDAAVEGGVYDCVAGLSDFAQPWQRYPCRGISRATLDVVCELEPVGKQSRPCEAGICIDLVKTLGSKRYYYQENRATADTANRGCSAMGGRLVVLQSREEREQLWHELSKLTVPPSAVWIGLSQVSPPSFRAPMGVWAWDDHTPADGPGSYPSSWSASRLRYPQVGTSRAFLYRDVRAPSYDDTLAQDNPSIAGGGMLPYVCEIPAQ